MPNTSNEYYKHKQTFSWFFGASKNCLFLHLIIIIIIIIHRPIIIIHRPIIIIHRSVMF